MSRPINLLLVRHGISEANLDREVHHRLPDPQVPLAPAGHDQARAAGKVIADWHAAQGGTGGMRLLISPYRRTRETAAGIEAVLAERDIAYDKREELALREIGFGLFDGYTEAELRLRFPTEQAYYQKYVDWGGEFYAPMPLGESRAQVADRVKPVFGSIIRDNRLRHDGSRVRNFVIVSHGVTIRAFIMQWMHLPYEWHQDEATPDNCSIALISSDGIAPYALTTLFEGFTKEQGRQEKREQGLV